MQYKCDNCRKQFKQEDCPDVKDPQKRFDVGGPWTDKECPECGALAYRMPGVKMRWAKRGSHVHVALFMGEDVEHMANCGTIRMYPKEFELLGMALSMAVDAGHCELLVEEVESVLDLS